MSYENHQLGGPKQGHRIHGVPPQNARQKGTYPGSNARSTQQALERARAGSGHRPNRRAASAGHENFSAVRRNAGFSIAAAAEALCVTTRTIRNWERGHTRAPYMAVKLLRLMRGGHIGHPGWDGWQLHQGKLYPPTGNNVYAPWEIEQLEAVFRQAKQFRTLYAETRKRDQLDPKQLARRYKKLLAALNEDRYLDPPTVIRRYVEDAANEPGKLGLARAGLTKCQ